VFAFCQAIILDATAESVLFRRRLPTRRVAPNPLALIRLHDSHPGMPVILDAKRGGSAPAHYAV
jgi:hypothetical protein